MNKDNYFEEKNMDNSLKLRAIRKSLPLFCSEFFIGIENRTAVLTRLNYAYDLKLFFSFLCDETPTFQNKIAPQFEMDDLRNISVTHIELFLEYLNLYIDKHGKKVSNSREAKSRKISAIRALFKYFYNKGQLERDVSAKVATPKLHTKPITRLEVDEIVKFLDDVESGKGLSLKQTGYHTKTKLRDIALLTLFLGTGIRISECVGLNVNDFDFENRSFKVTRKGGNQEILYFSDEILSALLEYKENRISLLKGNQNEHAMFISIQGTRISTRAIELLVKKYSTITTPLKRITPHKLRSTYGTNLYRETGDIYVVAEVLGHKDINTTKKHYAATSEDIKRKASNLIVLREKDENK